MTNLRKLTNRIFQDKEAVKKVVETGLGEYVANVQARWKRNNINTIVTFKFVVNIFKKYIYLKSHFTPLFIPQTSEALGVLAAL